MLKNLQDIAELLEFKNNKDLVQYKKLKGIDEKLEKSIDLQHKLLEQSLKDVDIRLIVE